MGTSSWEDACSEECLGGCYADCERALNISQGSKVFPGPRVIECKAIKLADGSKDNMVVDVTAVFKNVGGARTFFLFLAFEPPNLMYRLCLSD
jgi:hypothetical protein